MLRLYLLRHTPVAVPEGTCYGRTDVTLAPDWRADLARSLELVPRSVIEGAAVFSSPLERCARIARAIRADPVVDDRLREFDFGDWEMRRWDELPRAEIDRWGAELETWRVPGGECLGEVDARAAGFVDSLAARGEVLAVSHGGIIRCLLARALAMPLAGIARLRVDYGSLSLLTRAGGRMRVEYVNRRAGAAG